MAATSRDDIRPPAIAGTWYPGDPGALRAAVAGYIDKAGRADLPRPPIAIVSPHAGYTYSGPTAGHAYSQLRAGDYDRAVLLGPLHRPVGGTYGEVLAPSESAYQTPLGELAVDRDFYASLSAGCEIATVKGDREHSIEIQLPFLQVALGEIRIVPLMIAFDLHASDAAAAVGSLAEALSAAGDERTLTVVSTDLSHLNDHSEVVRVDARLIELVERFDTEALLHALSRGEVNACGGAGLVTALAVARRRGASRAKVLSYTTSGDVTGDKRPGSYTVGYMAAAVA